MDPTTATGIHLDTLRHEHWPEVREIYALGIATGHATFETEPPDWAEFSSGKVADFCHVALLDGRVIGWVGASHVSGRCVYQGVVEHSVYVHPDAAGKGVGRALLAALVTSTETAGVWTIESKVFPENTASLSLHKSAGFRQVGVRERLGRMTFGSLSGTWRDAVLIERRSGVAGT